MWKFVNLICQYFPVNATGMANMLICRHFANLEEKDGMDRHSQSYIPDGCTDNAKTISFQLCWRIKKITVVRILGLKKLCMVGFLFLLQTEIHLIMYKRSTSQLR